VPQPNGKAPQHHLTTSEIIAKALERRLVPWHWDALDIDVLIRPRTTAENAAVVDEGNKHNAAVEEYRGTPDEPTSLDAMRVRIRAAIPCVLWPDDKTPVFDHESVETLLELDSPSLMDLINKTDAVSNFTKDQAEENAKNSAAMADANTSSDLPEEVETSTSSPTPIR
jgi:hypothetical protein